MYNENAHERRLIHALNVRTTKHAERLTARSDSLSVVETVAAARYWSDRRSLSLSIARQLNTEENIAAPLAISIGAQRRAARPTAMLCWKTRCVSQSPPRPLRSSANDHVGDQHRRRQQQYQTRQQRHSGRSSNCVERGSRFEMEHQHAMVR